MLRKILSKRSKTKGPNAAAEEAKANVDLSKCLAQVQEILGKLRQGQEGQDPFPSLNEASRIGELRDLDWLGGMGICVRI